MAQTQKVSGRATSVFQHDGDTIVKYHNTNVVRFNAKTITLSTGGWKTVTTKVRMNQAANQFDLGYTVYQNNFNWFVQLRDGATLEFDDREITFDRQ